ncbi:MAG: alpha/beta fold hydrolase [Cyanobacteria bacterium P01_H01_bin.162]
MRQRSRFLLKKLIHHGLQGLTASVLSGGAIVLSALPSGAISEIAVKFGPTQTTLHISDLEAFAQTGQVPTGLQRYQAALTPTVQQALNNHLNVEPSIRDRFVQDLMDGENGRPFVAMLERVAPSLTPEIIQTALQTAETSDAGVTAITLLQSLPGDTLNLDGMALLRLLSQLGLSHLEQTALGQVLDRELNTPSMGALSPRFDPSVSGSQDFERWSVSFRDHDRDRVIPVDLYWSESAPGPTVVLSHGFGADRHFLDYLAQHLASHGLTVVALEHPGSNVDALIKAEGPLLPAEEFIERPRDVSFILDRLADLNQHSFFLRGHLQTDAVTLVGHSLGGYTGLVLAGGTVDPIALGKFCVGLEVGASSPADWFQCAATEATLPPERLADPRINQLVLMNPLAGHIFGDQGLRPVNVPALVVTSTHDGIASVSDQQLRPFNQLTGPRSLVAIIGGTHLSVGDPANLNPALTQVPFMSERPEDETLQLRQYLNGTVLSFVMQQTDQAEKYQAFLSSDYAAIFSTATLPIRYGDRLPRSIDSWLANRDRLTRRLTPTVKSLASLLHLELIGARHQIANLRRETIAQLPWQPIDLAARLGPRSPIIYQAADDDSIRESSRPAE